MTWLDGYERVPILGCTGPGTYVNGYPWRIVLHTTESPFGSGQGVINLFQGQPCSTPHFMIDPGTGRKVQFIPVDYSCAALRGGRNGYETNRGRAIQVEICGRADEAGGWPDQVLAFIGGWIADVVDAGYPIDLDNVTGNDYRGTVATESSPYRMSPDQWRAFDGVCGHIDVPFNDHYDPYHLDKRKVVEHAKQRLGHTPTPTNAKDWFDMATAADLDVAIAKALAPVLTGEVLLSAKLPPRTAMKQDGTDPTQYYIDAGPDGAPVRVPIRSQAELELFRRGGFIDVAAEPLILPGDGTDPVTAAFNALPIVTRT